MVTDKFKSMVVTLIDKEIAALGSARSVAVKVGLSDGYISSMRKGDWKNIADKAWISVANNLGYRSTEWQIVDTINYSRIETVLTDAQENSLFLAISYRAGSGKTTAAKAIAEDRRLQSVYLLQCREWGKREFLNNLCRCLGIELPRGQHSLDDLLQKVAEFFRNQSGKKPLLILDEADKLKQASLRTLIPLYNETEGILGCVILGTDHLQKDIKRGARMNQKGYDEIDSRFGRKFIELQGATLADVRAICAANGVADTVEQKTIFDACSPVLKQIEGRDVKVVEDLRAVKRAIQSSLLLNKIPV